MNARSKIPTPRELGFSMPPEWAAHDATWLTWPRDPGTWPGKLAFARHAMARWVREIVRDRPSASARQKPPRPPERVEINVCDAAQKASAARLLQDWDIDLSRVGFHTNPSNDVWIRDYGPIFVTRAEDRGDGYGRIACVDFSFDAWGGKGRQYYGDEYGLDGKIARRIAKELGVPRFAVPDVMEGGAIDVNGAGTLMAARDCVINLRRRAGRTPAERRAHVERTFADFLGQTHFLWVDDVAIEGDDTDGHIDNLARFAGKRTIVTVVAEDRSDPLFEPLKKNERALASARGADGRRFDVVAVPAPPAFRYRTRRWGKPVRWRYPASYANFYIANHVVLVPTFSTASDLPALEALAKLFPDRDIVGVDSCDYILGQGAVHCSTQQQPAAGAAR
ncbi:agmatine deiminase family protein [bacterium]|nr:agmatine deiminase family protein [bacterium]